MYELVMIFFMALAYLMLSKAMRKIEGPKAPDCPPHKWTYKLQPGTDVEYLVCDKCRAFPGSQLGEDL